ncbi:MAG: phosphoglucosamine mutase [Betaproteobacteria bacterium]|nr:phosphoglucosamine mutase [Betaproteobacteria bacterium]
MTTPSPTPSAPRKYFGTDGIRGRVGEHPITPEFVLRLGMALGHILAKRFSEPSVLIGKDTRVSGYMLEAALESGLASAGVDVVLAGPMPTPAIAYLTRTLRLSAGVVISASHNPFEDNGLKFFDSQGEKLPDAWELEMEAALEGPLSCTSPQLVGKARRLEDAGGRYIEFCKSTFPAGLNLRGLRLVVDAAHGAAYHVASDVFHELGAEVFSLGNRPDGFNINQLVGATAPEAMASLTAEMDADYGIALDGDGDRLIMADRSGRIFNGDELLYVVGKHRTAKRGKAAVGGLVGTLMSNLALEQRIEAMGLDFRRARVGDRYVLEMLKETGWQIGGESSGHLICLDRHSTGDGLVSALQVLGAVVDSGQALAQLLSDLVLYPQVLLNVPIQEGRDWREHAAFKQAQKDVLRELGSNGRLLVRASGTEPLLRIMVECREESLAQVLAERLARTLSG